MRRPFRLSDNREVNAAARLVDVAISRSEHLIADLADSEGGAGDSRRPVVDRLADALGRNEAERIVGMLSKEAAERIDGALTPAFARRLATLAEDERVDRAA